MFRLMLIITGRDSARKHTGTTPNVQFVQYPTQESAEAARRYINAKGGNESYAMYAVYVDDPTFLLESMTDELRDILNERIEE